MNEFDDIYCALQDGLASCEALDSWVTNADAVRTVRIRKDQIQRGLKALETLRNRKSAEPNYSESYDKLEGCVCAICGMPPCSWCTDLANSEDLK